MRRLVTVVLTIVTVVFAGLETLSARSAHFRHPARLWAPAGDRNGTNTVPGKATVVAKSKSNYSNDSGSPTSNTVLFGPLDVPSTETIFEGSHNSNTVIPRKNSIKGPLPAESQFITTTTVLKESLIDFGPPRTPFEIPATVPIRPSVSSDNRIMASRISDLDYELSDRHLRFMLANCSNEPVPRSLTVGVTDYYVQHYIFPVQFILGVAGNCINLIVLLSAGMKNQANTMLSAMAFADLGFLFCMLPHSLVSFSVFYSSVRFSSFYFATKTHAVGLANMFSTAATLLVLAVSLERFSGVRRPMHTRFQLRDTRIIGFILAVFAVSFALTFYHHVEYNVNISIGCNNVWATFRHISQVASSSKAFINYVRHAKYIHSIFGVALPVIIVAILNVSLIYILRRREILPRPVADKKQQNEFRYSDLGALQRQERKVTATVIAIITCFTVTHLPTLIPYIWEKVYTYRNVVTLLNMLLVSGKVLNFVLFCSSSAHFRRRTVTILGAYLCHKRYRKKYSSMIVSGAAPAGITMMLPHGNVFLNGQGTATSTTTTTTKTAAGVSEANWSGNGGAAAPDSLSCCSMPPSVDNGDGIPRRAMTSQRNLTGSVVGHSNTIATANGANANVDERRVPILVKRCSTPRIQEQHRRQQAHQEVSYNGHHNTVMNAADSPPLSYQLRRYEVGRSMSATLRGTPTSSTVNSTTLPLLAVATNPMFVE